MNSNPVIAVKKLGSTWETGNPFLFCVHHLDDFPAGNQNLGPILPLSGRNIGNDFDPRNSWRMYHGETIPGFPMHPHRGFETVTIVLKGFVDHADSAGGAGRYGNGDVQWMTAGKGLQHSEMFPLLNKDKENPLELFQIWLNLPQKSKFVEPYFGMFWNDSIPHYRSEDANGKKTDVTIIAGALNGVEPLQPSPDSWAADGNNEVAIWLISMDPNAEWALPTASGITNRTLFFFRGSSIHINELEISSYQSVVLHADSETSIHNGNDKSSLLLLQGKPIKEPVVQYGPFVMNSEAEIQQAFLDYRQTQFGKWPWPRHDQVHDRLKGRFAKYADGREELK